MGQLLSDARGVGREARHEGAGASVVCEGDFNGSLSMARLFTLVKGTIVMESMVEPTVPDKGSPARALESC